MDKRHNNDEEKSAFNQPLYAGDTPPPRLDSQILDVLKKRGLVKTPKPLLRASLPGFIAILSCAALLLGAGYYLGRRQAPPSDAIVPLMKPMKPMAMSGKKQFALLIRADDTPPEDPGQQFREYTAWLENLKQTRWASGDALSGRAWDISIEQGALKVIERPVSAGKCEWSGYFLFEAENYVEALRIAESCPHLQYRGTLELREIYK